MHNKHNNLRVIVYILKKVWEKFDLGWFGKKTLLYPKKGCNIHEQKKININQFLIKMVCQKII
jgi:hypothetical protein